MTRPLGDWRSPEGIARVTATTARIPLQYWGFGESIGVEAVLAAGGEHAQEMARRLQRWAGTRTLVEDPLAHVAPGVPLLMALANSRVPALLARVRELANVLATARVGRCGARIHRPDLARWSTEVWVDCMHLDGPFLARYAGTTGDAAWSDLAAEVLLSHARALQEEGVGLLSHGFDDLTGRPNRVYWGRGQGWALLGLVDTLVALPADHPSRREIEQRVRALIDALAQYEDGPGQWHTVVDRRGTYVEASISAFAALGVRRAMQGGVQLGPQGHLVERALKAAADRLTDAGGLAGVSFATPVGVTADDYAHVARTGGGADCVTWGQGPMLLALLEC